MRPAHLILVAVLVLAGGLGWLLTSSHGGEDVSAGAAAPEVVEEDPIEEPEPVVPRTPVANTRRDVEARPTVVEDKLSDIRGDPTDAQKLRAVGRVVDSEGEPLRGIRVQLGPSEPESAVALDSPDYPAEFFTQILRTNSDKDGQFEFLIDSDISVWTLAVRAPNFGHFDRFEIPLPSYGYFKLNDITLNQGVEISGRVLDSQGIAVAGAILLIVRDRGFDVEEPRFVPGSPLEVTDANGSFHITSFPAGLVQLMVHSENHPQKHYTSTSANPGDHLTNTVIHLEDLPPACTLTGIITASDEPLVGAIVRVYPNASDALDAETVYEWKPSVPYAETDARGAYKLEQLPLGSCTISVEHSDYSQRQLWTIRLEESAARCNLALESHALTGWIRDVHGAPIEGAQLRVERVRQNASKTGYRLIEGTSIPQPESLAIVRNVYSDADGSYRIKGLDASTGLVLIAELPWYATKQSNVFAFKTGQSGLELDLTLQAGGLISANVLLSSNNNQDSRLRATPLDQPGRQWLSAPLGPESILELGYLPPGRYLVELLIPRTPDAPEEIVDSVEKTVEGGQTVTLHFTPR
ncbi:MAG: protocatechuate 3,4-dioxygenase beta subunit [Planctomycetota bacterium]|jgi:protocatechuate 3,4-dioxygenase beta subunit